MERKLCNLNWIHLHKIFITVYSIPYTRVHINITSLYICSWEGFIFKSKIFLHQYMSTLPLSSLCEFLTLHQTNKYYDNCTYNLHFWNLVDGSNVKSILWRFMKFYPVCGYRIKYNLWIVELHYSNWRLWSNHLLHLECYGPEFVVPFFSCSQVVNILKWNIIIWVKTLQFHSNDSPNTSFYE